MIQLGLLGSTGRMGQAILDVHGKHQRYTDVCQFHAAASRKDSFEPLLDVDVVIDFSLPEGLEKFLSLALDHPTPPRLVSGTTGLNEAQNKALNDYAEKVPVVYGTNMSLGIQWLLKIIQETPEFIRALQPKWHMEETHHTKKKDAPSGTAKSLTERIEQIGEGLSEPCISHRIGDEIGTHEVSVTLPFERITLTHKALDRHCFAEGALNASLWLAKDPATKGMFSLEEMLGRK